MKLLLDTHTFMWWDSQFDRISPTTQEILQNPENEIWVSIVSLWEMQIKVSRSDKVMGALNRLKALFCRH